MRAADLIAGITVAGILLPEAVAYSAIAGLPAGRAVVAAIAGSLAYAAVGRSRFAILAPTSSSAAILGGLMAAPQVAPLNAGSVATAATLLAGAMFVIGAALGFGRLSALIPRPVLRGFAFGVAVTIIIRQAPYLLGSGPLRGTVPEVAWGVVAGLPGANPWTVATGVVSLALYLLLRRVPAIPAAFATLAAGAGASVVLSLGARGVALTGPVGVPSIVPAWPDLAPGDWIALAPFVLPLVLILLAEGWGTVSALSAARGETADPGREVLAFGIANIASALVRGMPVGAGFSAGAAADASGAATRLTAVAAAGALAAFVFLAGPVMAALPRPVLAAVVIGTLAHALSPAPFLRLWHLGRDVWIAAVAAVAVIALGVLNGMLAAVALSLAALVRRLMTPRIARLGRLDGGRDFVDVERHPEARMPEGTLIYRPSEPMFFGNAAAILDRIGREVASRGPGVVLILSLEETFDLDSTTLDALLSFEAVCAGTGATLLLARVHDHVRDVLRAAGRTDLIDRAYYSVDDAVLAARAAAPPAGKDRTDVP
ncbi:MAG: SulP family inorganic anion transporter [Pseudomonadota bacterium]